MVVKRQQETFKPVTMGHIRLGDTKAEQHTRLFFLGLLVGLVIGAAGAMIYRDLPSGA